MGRSRDWVSCFAISWPSLRTRIMGWSAPGATFTWSTWSCVHSIESPGPADVVGASAVGIDSGLIGQEDVLAGQAEDGEVAGELGNGHAVDDDVGVRVGAADAGHGSLLEELVPLRKVFVGC